MTLAPEPLDAAGSPAAGGATSFGRLRVTAGAHPVAVVWLGTIMFSTGPVMVAASTVSGPVFSFWRLWVGVPVLAVAAWFQMRRTGHRPDRAGWFGAVGAGTAFAVHQLLFMTALKATSVVDVTLMNTLAPVVVAVLAVPLFGERPGMSFRLWSLVAMAGAAMVAVAGSAGPQGNPAGMALAAGNVVFYAIYFVWSKQLRGAIDTWPFLCTALTTAAVVVSAFVLVAREPVGDISTHDLLLCLAVAVLPGALGHFAVTWSLAWVPANVPPVILLSMPVLSGLLAWVVLGQTTTAGKVLGGAITLVGVLGALRAPGATVTVEEALDLAEEA
ncbi:MAG: DMT family transporter [Acidimicrobiales bacterium]